MVFKLTTSLRISAVGSGKSLQYATTLLERIGATIDRSDGTISPDQPAMFSGDALPLNSECPPSPHIVRLWDFHVGKPGSGILASASSGVSWVIGIPKKAPLYLPADIPEKWCGTLGASMALSYFVEHLSVRSPYQSPRFIDVSAAEILRSFADQNFGNHKQIPTSWRRNGRISPDHGGIYPQGFYECKDGYVGVVGRSRQDWAAMLRALGDPVWATDELRNPFELAHHPEKVDHLFVSELKKFSRKELLDKALETGATFAPVFQRSEIPEQHIVRESFFLDNGQADLPFEIVNEAVGKQR